MNLPHVLAEQKKDIAAFRALDIVPTFQISIRVRDQALPQVPLLPAKHVPVPASLALLRAASLADWLVPALGPLGCVLLLNERLDLDRRVGMLGAIFFHGHPVLAADMGRNPGFPEPALQANDEILPLFPCQVDGLFPPLMSPTLNATLELAAAILAGQPVALLRLGP
jgi:hypothetical protein